MPHETQPTVLPSYAYTDQLSRYVRTPILDKNIQEYLTGEGVNFATVEDACNAMLKISSDTTLNGMLKRTIDPNLYVINI